MTCHVESSIHIGTTPNFVVTHGSLGFICVGKVVFMDVILIALASSWNLLRQRSRITTQHFAQICSCFWDACSTISLPSILLGKHFVFV